jgi:hypothetical protein
MKNKYQKITSGFLFLLLLVNSFAYGGGKLIKKSNNTEVNTQRNEEDLISDLSKNKNFAKMYELLCTARTYNEINSLNASSEELTLRTEKLKSYAGLDNLKSATVDNTELADLLSFSDELGLKLFNDQVDFLKNDFAVNFPEIMELSISQAEVIIEKAISQGGFQSNFVDNWEKTNCYKDAMAKWEACVAGNGWFTFALRIALGVCIVGILAAGIAIIYIGVGTTTGQVIAFLGSAATFCAKELKGFVNSPITNESCDNLYQQRYKICADTYGLPDGIGAAGSN